MSSHAAAPGDRSVPWLDVFPKACSLKPVKYVCAINSRSLPETTDSDTEFRYVDISNVDSDGNWVASEPMRFGDSPSRARRVVADGDVIVSTVRTYLRAIAHIDRVGEPTICSTGFAVLSANGVVLSKFLAYWARSVHFVDEVVARSVGVSYPAVNAPDLGNIPCPVLPPDEQRAITAFLDRETARIDTLIEKKRRQIELLHEKRAALISHAVTKGLDPTVPMKDSGIPGLGRVPLSWAFKRLKYLTPQITVGVVVTPSVYYVDEGIPFLRSLNIKEDGVLSSDMAYLSAESNHQLHKSSLTAGDLVSVRTGQPGTTAVIDEQFDGVNCIDLIITRRSAKFDSRFMCYAMNSALSKSQYAAGASGAIQAHFNVETAGNMLIPAPSIATQIAVREYLDESTTKIRALVGKINASIDRLREYRTALISAAVTGKIDLRQEVA